MQNRRFEQIGLPPGSLVHIGKVRQQETRITVNSYGPEEFTQFEIETPEQCRECLSDDIITWINIDGIQDVDIIRKFGELFSLDNLVLEDILNTEQRPKTEDFSDYFFIVTKMLAYDRSDDTHNVEHFCLVLGSNYLLTFQEVSGDVLDIVRKRIEKPGSRFRTRRPDYLAYAIVDTLIDYYLISIDRSRDRIEELEERLLDNETGDISDDLHMARREQIELRKILWPMKEVVNNMYRSESPMLEAGTSVFLRDTYDHILHFTESLEHNRELLVGLQDMNMSNISNRMNQIMKVLTIIATIFIPLTFIAGVYGMNFEYMPELDWPWAYPMLWLLMAGVGISLFALFKKKKWL